MPPDAQGAYAPLLEHNGQGGWWHEFEEPLAWDGLRHFVGSNPAPMLCPIPWPARSWRSAVSTTRCRAGCCSKTGAARAVERSDPRFRQAQMDSPWSEVGDCDPGTDLQATFIRQQFRY
ncbi:hypothetical protein QNM99_15060 [Pseudomonas sp. PCH446]